MNTLLLIGNPLGHSFSQRYFEAKFARDGIEGWQYRNAPMADIETLRETVSSDPTLRGFNVTIPHKRDVMRMLDKTDTEAVVIGAVNCVKVSRIDGFKGKIADGILLEGFNTDVYGFRDSLSEVIGARRPDALVLGTGGASKAVCHALGTLGIKYETVSRQKSATSLGYDDLDSSVIKGHKLIINTTPLGMYPNTETAPEIDYTSLTENHILFDLVYNPGDTLFLRHGRRARATVVGGYGMLVRQAEIGWEIFSR